MFDAAAFVAVLATSAPSAHQWVVASRCLRPIAEVGGAIRGGVALSATAEADQIFGPSRRNLAIAAIVRDLRVLGPALLLGHLGFGRSLVLLARSVLILFGITMAASRRRTLRRAHGRPTTCSSSLAYLGIPTLVRVTLYV